MSKYNKNTILKALSFWKTKLDESKSTVESEEDQKKEAAEKQADQEQAEIDAQDTDDSMSDDEFAMPDDTESTGSDDLDDGGSEDDSDSSDDMESTDLGDDGFEGSDEDDSDNEESEEDDDSEDDDSEDDDSEDDDSEDDDSEDDDTDEKSEFKLEITTPNKKFIEAIPELCKKFGSKISISVTGVDSDEEDGENKYTATIECDDEEIYAEVENDEIVKAAVDGTDEDLNESLRYEPNTVGAVIKLLSKSDPHDFLFIRLAPNMKQCMIYDIDRKIAVDGQSTTYMEIAIGSPN